MVRRRRKNGNFEMTAVQFPRFQYEKEVESRLLSDKVFQRAQPRPWLSPMLFKAINNPLEVAGKDQLDLWANSGWWGEWHYATQKVMPPAILPDPTTLRRRIFCAQLLEHEYQWDFQAYAGNRYEAVLTVADAEGPITEVAALLGKTRESAEQQMVIHTPEVDEWHEPSGDVEESIAHSYAFYMALLANRPSE